MKTNQYIPLCLRAAAAGLLAFCATSSLAQVTSTLYGPSGSTVALRNNYTGVVGCDFQVGESNVVVSHLGYFDLDGDGLFVSHNAAVFSLPLAGPIVLGQVTVPAGTDAYLTNNFRWVQLDPPLLLQSNTVYLLGGLAASGDGDQWTNSYAPTWNVAFVGTNANATRHSIYGPGNATWPPVSLTRNQNNQTYGNVCLGYIGIGPAKVGVAATSVATGAGSTLSVIGFGSGEQPISYQWHGAGGTPISGQTNATLVIPNASVGSYSYYLTATNALGGAQSANVDVTITAFPVGISQQPTNLTVFANYTASFFTTATGTPPISYQWSRNGTPIAGATGNSYSLTVTMADNGAVYSCLASNYIGGTPYTATTSNATLSVIYNLAQPQQLLHGAPTGAVLNRSNYTGTMGGHFTVGNSLVTVTHLGYFAPIGQYLDASNASLTQSHQVGIFDSAGTTLIASVTVPAGNSPVVNGYIWVALEPSLVLASNTQYLLMTEVFTDVDPYPDTRVVPDLNPYFATTCNASYGNAWPAVGNFGNYAGQMYGAPNLAILAAATPTAFVAPAAATQYANLSTNFTALISGQPPVSVQWYKQAGQVLAGQTNLTLNLNNLTFGDAGNYYVVATNIQTAANTASPDVNLTVLPDVGPTIIQDIQSQDAFVYQTVQFVAVADGTPPLSYQWKFNGSPIAGATNSTLTLNSVSTANVGNYQLVITNPYAPYTVSSGIASLGVQVPLPGTYPAAVMSPNLLAYYRFSGANSGFGIATNQGALGLAANGTYEGFYAGLPGPTGSNFEPGNLAIDLDGLTADVRVAPLNATLTSATIAAWVYKSYDQVPDAAIFWQRGGSIFGLSVNPDPVTGSDALRYTWNGTYFNFVSGLILPTNEWALVAMSVTPTEAKLYLQDGAGQKSTNNIANHPSQNFTANSYVGWDTAGGNIGRRWLGDIDEVMVFNRALSADEINALYLGVPGNANLTIEPAGNNVVLKWTAGKLLEATSVTGPWTTNAVATSPYSVPATAAQKYYRVQLSP